MTTRLEVMMWAQRVIAMKQAPAHQLLELPATATQDDAQAAFHRIARMAHPDLHRTGLTADELELVTTAYSIIANAYQAFRAHGGMAMPRTRTPNPDGPSVAVTPAGVAPLGNASQQMSARALVYFRKAELALKRGDLKGALLQLKMAVGSDPGSAFLRTALAEVETEVRKGP